MGCTLPKNKKKVMGSVQVLETKYCVKKQVGYAGNLVHTVTLNVFFFLQEYVYLPLVCPSQNEALH